jgi:hypothetical protein
MVDGKKWKKSIRKAVFGGNNFVRQQVLTKV